MLRPLLKEKLCAVQPHVHIAAKSLGAVAVSTLTQFFLVSLKISAAPAANYLKLFQYNKGAHPNRWMRPLL
jgi:hypothetical protein